MSIEQQAKAIARRSVASVKARTMGLARRLPTPVKEPLKAFIRRAQAARGPVARLDDRLGALETGWNRHVPALLNAVSSVGAFGHELLRVRQDLERQIEDLRQSVERLSQAGDGEFEGPRVR
jgi:hypothetical protein